MLVGTGTFDPPTTALDADGQGRPYATYGFAAQLAEVEVDTGLGRTVARRIVAAHDVGRAINPTQVEGQIHGGIAQGLGLALMEEYVPGRTENLHDYLIPTIGDVPPIEILLIEDAEPLGPYGAKGIGEPALIPTAPAILGAIEHAVGVRLSRVPATPDRVRAAIVAAPAGARAMATEAAAEADGGIVTCDACPVLCRIRPGRTGACDRYGNVDGALVRMDPMVVVQKTIDESGQLVPFLADESGRRMGRPPVARRAEIPDRHWLGHDLPGLQAGAVHRRQPACRGRRRHGRHRGHLQLLRHQGEDRHRPLCRPGAGRGALRRRAGRPRDDGRIRLADAGARRRAPPDRRLQERGQGHLRHDAQAVQQGARWR